MSSTDIQDRWTVEVLNQVSGHWVDFCLDAPLLLADAEERERMLQAEQPKAKFRIVPWLNSDQRQFVQKQNDASKQTIQQLWSVADKLAEALKDVDSAMTSGPMTLNEARKILRAALAEYAEMKSDKLASSGGLPTDTGASQGGRG